MSIVIPSRNEAEDIAATLEACLRIDYEPIEIIVVDDSTDGTPDIVARYVGQGVRLIHRLHNSNGCCGARNFGMKSANGEILVVMNADDRPSPSFLTQLIPHYQNGADYVVVRSVVKNPETIWAKFIWTDALRYFSTNPDMEWSEGFSCRKSAAEKVGYIPGDFQVPFCRDYLLGTTLNNAGFLKHRDLDISMEHVAPDDFASFFSNRVWRGTFTAPFGYYFYQRTIITVLLREVLKLGRTIIGYILIFPVAWKIYSLVAFANIKDVPGFLLVNFVQDLAFSLGGFKGFLRLWSITRKEIQGLDE